MGVRGGMGENHGQTTWWCPSFLCRTLLAAPRLQRRRWPPSPRRLCRPSLTRSLRRRRLRTPSWYVPRYFIFKRCGALVFVTLAAFVRSDPVLASYCCADGGRHVPSNRFGDQLPCTHVRCRPTCSCFLFFVPCCCLAQLLHSRWLVPISFVITPTHLFHPLSLTP